MIDKMLECLNALVQADPDVAEMTLLRKSRLSQEAAGKLSFYTSIGHRGDAEITPLNILNACLKQVGEEPVAYIFSTATGRFRGFVKKKTLTTEEILKQYEGEYLPLTKPCTHTVAHSANKLSIKVSDTHWDVYTGISFDLFSELVLSPNPIEFMAKELGHRSYLTVKEEPK